MGIIKVFEVIGAILTILSVFSIVTNLIQFTKRKENDKEMRSQMQMQFNNYNFIARVCTRMREIEEKPISQEEKNHLLINEMNVVRGIADSSRLSIISYSREQLNYVPHFEHPAFPGRKDFSDAVILGAPPEKEASFEKKEA